MPQSAEHKKIRKLLENITNKRARIVIEHILENGFVTTEHLEKHYGYNHPPRAARDVREFGIPLETFRVKDSEGRSIAAYRFGDINNIQKGRLEGRQLFQNNFGMNFTPKAGVNAQFVMVLLNNAIYKLTIESPMKLREIHKTT